MKDALSVEGTCSLWKDSMTSNPFRWKSDSFYSGNEVQGIMPCRGVEGARSPSPPEAKRRLPARMQLGSLRTILGDGLLSHDNNRSIIGDGELNCRVRNGIGCTLSSMTTKEIYN